jgi:hypothetical protein
MLFFERYDDLHASCKNRKDLVDLLKLRFNNLNRNVTLRCFGVTIDQLRTVMKTNTPQNKRSGVYDLPEDSTRMLQDEIKGEEEYIKGTVDDSVFEAKPGFNAGGESDTGFHFNGGDGDVEGDDMDLDQSEIRQSVLVGFNPKKDGTVKYEDFKLQMLLGRGTFGKVFLAELVKQKKMYAIKAIRKDVLIEYN